MTAYTQQSRPGSRADAEPTDRLPTLVPGRDRLPTSCGHCGSGMLDQEPPLGPHQRGMLWCQMCSRSLCWLAAPLAAISRRSMPLAASPPPVAATAPAPLVVPRRIIAAEFMRRPGCGPSCTLAYGHDPATHEQHGADAVYAELRARRSGDVATGRLLVQLGPARVYVDRAEVALSPTEYRILAHLAERLGDVCSVEEVTRDVWGARYVEDGAHLLRVNLARLRADLGHARSLLETARDHGYRLADAPPC